MNDDEKIIFRMPARMPVSEEIVPPAAIQTALLYKIFQEIRKTTEQLAKLVEDIRSRGEVFQMRTKAGEDWSEIRPGWGLWKGVNIYNRGDGECEARLRRLDVTSITIGSGESRSYMFLTPCIDVIYIRCSPSSEIELEFLR
jgi:hypothetical protein